MCVSSIDRGCSPTILSIAMGGAKSRWRWVGLLVAGLPLGCICGGQTGECFGGSRDSAPSSAGNVSPPCNSARPIGFAELSELGYSAADLLTALGGERTGTLSEVDPGFWEALGIEAPEAAEVGVVLSLDYAGGPVTFNECRDWFDVTVTVTLELGDGLIARSGEAIVEGTTESAWLQLDLLPPAEPDDTEVTVSVIATLTPTGLGGRLLAGPLVSSLPPPEAQVSGAEE
jgi:hypothetical protein